MTQRQPLVAANWKMNGTLDTIRPLVNEILAGLDGNRNTAVVMCVPNIYLPELSGLLKETGVLLGAQNVSQYESGAFTGEVSAAMLQDYDCRYVIVGHSERRNLYGESDE